MDTLLTKDTLPVFVETLLATIQEKGIHLILLEGDLGTGKTTCTQALARLLNVTEAVLSPTFVLMKTYQTTHPVFTKLTHIDAYRIEDQTLFSTLQLKKSLEDTHTLFCVEWPKLIPELAVYPHVFVQLTYGSTEDERHVLVTYHD